MAKLKTDANDARFHCPGCECSHRLIVVGEGAWGWNGDTEKPTLTPSILWQSGDENGPIVCHSFVTDGKIQFLGDCTHTLAGSTVDLPDIE